MKKSILVFLVSLAMVTATPTAALAQGLGGSSIRGSSSSSYHASFGSSAGSYSGYKPSPSSGSSSSALSPSHSTSLGSKSASSGSYSSGPKSYSGSSSSSGTASPPSSGSGTPSSGSGTYHSGYTAPSYSSRSGSNPVYTGSGARSYGGHFGSFLGGFVLGSMLHPFGWGFGGGYYPAGPGYAGPGWGGPGYSPGTSIVGTIVDILLLGFVIWLLVRLFRAFGRRRRRYDEPIIVHPGGTSDPRYVNLTEQDVVDACCEFIARREGCTPQQVAVDLQFERDPGVFAADARIWGRHGVHLTQQDLVDAVAEMVARGENVRPDRIMVDLLFNESTGVGANVKIL